MHLCYFPFSARGSQHLLSLELGRVQDCARLHERVYLSDRPSSVLWQQISVERRCGKGPVFLGEPGAQVLYNGFSLTLFVLVFDSPIH